MAVENSSADRTILRGELAKLTGADLLLVHVADGWAARHFDDENGSGRGEEGARAYLEQLASELSAASFRVTTELAMGDPPPS